MSLTRRTAVALALTSCFLTNSVFAADSMMHSMKYSQTDFEMAQKAGKQILVEITAPWCPTCKAQAPILSELRAQPKFKDLTVFSVDFDSQKDVVRALKATSQSTLIVFKGAAEMGRSVGDTKKESIEGLLGKSL